MAKITPKLLKKVTQDVETAQDQMGDMLKTSDPMLPSMQKAEQMGQQAIRQTRSGESDVGGRFINALFGSLTGQPERNTQELIKERYISLFPSQEQGEQNYLEATQYLGQVIKGEDPSAELPFNDENSQLLVENSNEFDNWLNEVVFDLENFRSQEPKESPKAPKVVSGQ